MALPGPQLRVPQAAGTLHDAPGATTLRLDEVDGEAHDWVSVAGWVGVDPGDRVFTVDRVRGELRFGDGRAGRVPRPAPGGRAVVRYLLGAGPAGNLGSGSSWAQQGGAEVGVNRVPAAGGTDAEGLDAGRQRAADELVRPDRTVTRDDVTDLALASPGVDVRRVLVSVDHHPLFPCAAVPGAVTVTVVPGADRDAPVAEWTRAPEPDPGLLEAVRRQLEGARLLGQEVYVGPPRYRAVRVWMEITRSATDDAIAMQVTDALVRHLDPLSGGAGAGRAFGEPLRPSDLLGVAGRAAGPEATVTALSVAVDDGAAVDCGEISARASRPGLAGRGTGQPRHGRPVGRWPAMSVGRDIRTPDLTMTEAPVAGGLEPRLFADGPAKVRAAVAGRIAAYVPEWTDRTAADAGVALLGAHGALGAAVTLRLNRLPRRLALAHLDLAGVRARPGTPATALLSLQVADRAPAPIEVAAGTVLVTPAGGSGPVLETTHACTALPGAVAAVAVLADGWLVVETSDDLGELAPFGARRRAPAELWIGIRTPAQPAGLLSLAFRHAARPGRLTAAWSASTVPDPPPAVRWEALTAAGPAELAVERDGTRGLTRNGVLVVRAETPAQWAPRTLPGRDGDEPLVWLRARLTTGTFPADALLAAVTVNGVAALARRTIRQEVAEPIERRPSGRSRYRLSQVPVVPGTVRLEIADTAGDPFGLEGDVASEWEEVPTLAGLAPDRRAFTLDPGTGILTFGDGVQGRAVPAGYRNVVALEYGTGGGTVGLPGTGDTLSSERSLPGLTGATVLSITTGADLETPAEMLRRGGATIRSRQRAVASADYAALAVGTPGVEIARAHALPARDARLGAGAVPGSVTVVVLPVAQRADRPPTPSAETLAAVAEHLAVASGVLGASVVTVSPAFREVSANALLVATPGADLATLESLVRDRIDDWLGPTSGGDGTGWPFGGTVRWDALVRVLVAEFEDLDAVARLSFRVGGRRLAPCADVPLAPDELVWPGSHVLETQRSRADR